MWEAIAALLGKMAEGALNWMGSNAAQHWLGVPQIIDTRSWIENAVQELEKFISADLKRQLDEHDLTQMTDF
jgi:hypothetical protein